MKIKGLCGILLGLVITGCAALGLQGEAPIPRELSDAVDRAQELCAIVERPDLSDVPELADARKICAEVVAPAGSVLP